MNIFNKIQQGDSTSWHDDPATLNNLNFDSSGYTLKYELRGPGAPLTLTAAIDGNGWMTSLTTAQSEALTPGTWWFSAYYSATSIRVQAGEGELVVTPDLTLAGTNFSNLSIAETALQAAEGALATFNASGGKVKKYQIGLRSMEFSTIDEILKIIAYWKAQVLNEKTTKDLANGKGNPRRLYVGWR